MEMLVDGREGEEGAGGKEGEDGEEDLGRWLMKRCVAGVDGNMVCTSFGRAKMPCEALLSSSAIVHVRSCADVTRMYFTL